MPATGELTLDISQYEEGMATAIADVAKLTEVVKIGAAQLKLMEQAFRKSGEASGYTAAQIETATKVQKSNQAALRQSASELKAFENALGVTEKKTSVATQAASGFKKALALTGIGAGIAAVVGFAKETINLGSNLKDTAAAAGVTTEQLQRIQAALANSLSADEAASALAHLNEQLEAAKTSVDAQEALAKLGATVADTPVSALYKFADAINQAKSDQDKLTLATETFGESIGRRIIPAAQGGGDAMRKLGKEARIASDDAINSAAAVARTLQNAPRNVQLTTMGATQRPESPDKAKKTTLDSSLLESQKDYLKAESEIAKELAPEYVKQQQLMVAEQAKLNAELEQEKKLHPGIVTIKQLELQSSLDKIDAEKRAAQDADFIAGAEIERDRQIADAKRGYYDDQKTALKELDVLKSKRFIADLQGDKRAVAQIDAEIKMKRMAIIEAKEAHDDELAHLKYQTLELKQQYEGMDKAAALTAVIAKYDAEIVKQLRLGNKEAVAMLQTQKALEVSKAKAALHDVTPAEKVAAHLQEQQTNRKARQQDARDAEIQRNMQRGVKYDKNFVRDFNERRAAAADAAAREKQAANMAAKQMAVMDAILQIRDEVKN